MNLSQWSWARISILIAVLGSLFSTTRGMADTPPHTLPGLENLKSRLYSVALSPNGEFIACGGSVMEIQGVPGGYVHLWSMKKKQLLRRIPAGLYDVYCVTFSPDSKMLAVSGDDSIVCLLDVKTGKIMRRLPAAFKPGSSPIVGKVAFSPDGKTVAADCSSGIIIWDVNTGARRRFAEEYVAQAGAIVFSPDGKTIINTTKSGAYTSPNRAVQVWDVKSGKVIRRLKFDQKSLGALAFSHSGQLIAGGSFKESLLWDASTGEQKKELPQDDWVWSIAFSPDDTILASGSGGNDGDITLWSIPSGTVIERLPGHTGRVTSVAFSPDGKTLASASEDGTVRLWSMEKDKQ